MLDKVRKHNRLKRPRGYDPAGNEAFDLAIAALSETNITKSVLYALSFHARLIAPWLLVFWGATDHLAFLALAPVIWVWTASCQRALENLVHDGSHFNWSRRNKACNDLCVNLFAAWPMLQEVAVYRERHLRHHGLFDTDEDPCRNRVVMQVLRRRPEDTIISRVLRLAPHLLALNREFFRTQIAGPAGRRFATYALWHTIAYVLPLALVVGPAMAIPAWCLSWLIPQIIVLPIIRTLAESDEHDYDCPGSELDATFTNDGFVSRWLIHPAGDAYHAAHHLRMGVPTYRMKKLDRLLQGSEAYARHNRRK